LNVSNNNVGQLSAEGWTFDYGSGSGEEWQHTDGSKRHQHDPPPNAKPEGAIALANAIPNMRAISQFTFSGDRRDSKPVTMETSMTEAHFSGKGLGLSGAIMLSAFLPKCT
jgi:hypothetical protein